MLFSLTRKTSIAVCLMAGFFCISLLFGVVCLFSTTSTKTAQYHLEQAEFYQSQYNLTKYSHLSGQLLFLSEKELLASLFVHPYQAATWNKLASVAQSSNKPAVANKALRFSHKFSSSDYTDILKPMVILAYNDTGNRTE